MRLDTRSEPGQIGGGDAHWDPFDDGAETSRGALSVNTERAVRSDLAIYFAWCTERGVPALPAQAETIAAFIDDRARVRAPATVRRYVSSVAAAHRTLGLERTARSEPVRRALQRMHRGTGRRQEQAKGLTWAFRERLLNAAGDALIDARNRALLAVAYDTLLRRGELVALEVRDIVEEPDGAATVLVRRSKTDPEGRGATVYVARDSMALVHVWLERSGVCEGKVFRSLSPGRPRRRAGRGPCGAYLQAHGARSRPARRAGRSHLRAQHPRGRCPGHGRRRDRHGGHPERRTVENHRDGQPLRRAPPCATKRGGAACAASTSRVGAREEYDWAHPGGAGRRASGRSVPIERFPQDVIGRQFRRAGGECHRGTDGPCNAGSTHENGETIGETTS